MSKEELDRLKDALENDSLLRRFLKAVRNRSQTLFYLFLVILFSLMLSLTITACAVLAHKDEGQSSLLIVPKDKLDALFGPEVLDGPPNPESSVDDNSTKE